MTKSIRFSSLLQLLSLGAASLLVACVPAPETDGQDGDDASESEEAGTTALGTTVSGWTNFKASADTRKIYVSSSTGNDANDGKSSNKPVKTLKKGASLLEGGRPDWLLLKRGDVWVNETLFTDPGADAGKDGVWTKSGRGAAEPLLISSYGDPALPRPHLRTGHKSGIVLSGTVKHVAIVGLHLSAHTRDTSDPGFKAERGYPGVSWAGNGDGLLLEDLYVDHYKDAVIVQSDYQNAIQNVKIRRNVLVDSYQLDTVPAPFGHSQGIYAEKVMNLVIEENVIDHNGWAAGIVHAEKTQYNHDIYVQVDCKELTVQHNMLTRAGGHGLQARPGGVVSDNLFVRDSLAMSFGLVRGEHDPLGGGVVGQVSGNVILEGADLSSREMRGHGIEFANIKSAAIYDNIIAHDTSASKYGYGLSFTKDSDFGVHGLALHDNIVYDWGNGIQLDAAAYDNISFKDNVVETSDTGVYLLRAPGGVSKAIDFAGNTWFTPGSSYFQKSGSPFSFAQWKSTVEHTATSTKAAFVDPNRSMASYSKSLGKAASFDAFIAEARKQSRGHYLPAYTTKAAIDYIRKGFATP